MRDKLDKTNLLPYRLRWNLSLRNFIRKEDGPLKPYRKDLITLSKNFKIERPLQLRRKNTSPKLKK